MQNMWKAIIYDDTYNGSIPYSFNCIENDMKKQLKLESI